MENTPKPHDQTYHSSSQGLAYTEVEWMADGNCKDRNPEMFPSDGVGVAIAKRICSACVVRTECLEYALVNRIDHGVWGGASERERRRIIRSRRLGVMAVELR